MPELVNGKTTYSLAEWVELPIMERHGIEKEMLFKHLGNFSSDVIRRFVKRMDDGLIDGTSYFDNNDGCACVLGSLLSCADALSSYSSFKEQRLESDVLVPLDLRDFGNEEPFASPVETMVLNVKMGDTPETDENLALVKDWTLDYLRDHEFVAV